MEWGFRRGGWFGIVPLTPWVLVQLAGIVVKDPCCSGQAESGFGMNFVKAFCAYDITIIPLPIPYPIPSLALSFFVDIFMLHRPSGGETGSRGIKIQGLGGFE